MVTPPKPSPLGSWPATKLSARLCTCLLQPLPCLKAEEVLFISAWHGQSELSQARNLGCVGRPWRRRRRTWSENMPIGDDVSPNHFARAMELGSGSTASGNTTKEVLTLCFGLKSWLSPCEVCVKFLLARTCQEHSGSRRGSLWTYSSCRSSVSSTFAETHQ